MIEIQLEGEVLNVEVSLSRRIILLGSKEINLSNYNIKHLRKLSDNSFDESKAEKAVRELIFEQILPFLRSSGRPLSKKEVEKEFEEAFEPHLYTYVFE